MPRLSSRSKHVEFESNSAFQIRNYKEIKAEKVEKSNNFAEGCENFAPHEIVALCEISHCDLPIDFLFCDFSHFPLHVLWVLRVFL